MSNPNDNITEDPTAALAGEVFDIVRAVEQQQTAARTPWGWALIQSPLTATVCIGEQCPSNLRGLPNLRAVYLDQQAATPVQQTAKQGTESRVLYGDEPLDEQSYTPLKSSNAASRPGPTAAQVQHEPFCRDCADFGPICPNSGKPCGGGVR